MSIRNRACRSSGQHDSAVLWAQAVVLEEVKERLAWLLHTVEKDHGILMRLVSFYWVKVDVATAFINGNFVVAALAACFNSELRFLYIYASNAILIYFIIYVPATTIWRRALYNNVIKFRHSRPEFLPTFSILRPSAACTNMRNWSLHRDTLNILLLNQVSNSFQNR